MRKAHITIGTIAYNEEQNIANLLNSILKQKSNSFVIDEILVYSDGSTDSTADEVKKFKDKKIVFIENKKRIGKSEHLNRLFKRAKNEIIVLFDADVILASVNTIENLIQPLLKNEDVMFVGGNPKPTKGTTFIEKAVNTTFYAYYPLKQHLRGGDNIYGCDGRILALKRTFGRTIKVPKNTFANDAYMYYSCLSKGHTYKHVPNAVVWFRSPINIADQVKQNKRFVAAHKQMYNFFGDIALREYFVPKKLLYKLMLRQFIKHPIQSSVIFLLNIYCKYKSTSLIGNLGALWPIATSTKGGIYAKN